LHEFLSLLYLYLTQPRQDDEAFIAWKAHQMEKFLGKEQRGSAEFLMDKISNRWYPEVPFLGKEDLQEITRKDIFQATAEWFSDLRDYTFIVTGDFNDHKVLTVLIKTLSVFPIKHTPISATTTTYNFPLKKMQENLEYKNIDGVYANLFFPIKVKREIKTQIELKLLSRALNDRIRPKLRDGSYSPVARGEWLDVKNGIFAFRIEFDSALGDEKRMLHAAIEEFRSLREKGVDHDWLKTAITEELRVYESRFASFGYFNFWPDYLQLKLENNEDPAKDILMYGTILEHFIDLEDINTAAKKFLDENHMQQFLGFPEGYKEVN
jgi:predicted Zn-dependent peptidase